MDININNVKFASQAKSDFVSLVNKRVLGYFKENKISRFGNWKMYLKTTFMFALYFTPYFFLIFGGFTNIWLISAMWILMGFGMAGIGLSVMHDACHGAFSKSPFVNKLVSLSMNMLGGSRDNWVMQHNVLHHTYTNVDGLDDDIDAPKWILRFSPHQKRYKTHRFQYLYAWLFYGLMTISWILSPRDFVQLFKYKKEGVVKTQSKSFGHMLTELIIGKLAYITYILIVPILILDIPWWGTLLLFLGMHYIAGFILSTIFQPAHVMGDSEFPLPEGGVIDNTLLEHQMYTTCNFAPKSPIFSWYVGGLNYQIEHHLFPQICHIHYKRISKIVSDTAKEFNLPYNSQPTFRKALIEHGKMLKKLGRED